MNFVISNVTTVEEKQEDDEPLYEVKKVSILREKRDYKSDSQCKVKVTKYTKSCYVPLCPNSSVTTPDKMFITVPVNPIRRKQWLDVVGKTAGKNPKSPMFCCQDHFNLEKDMRNYEEHLRRGKVQMLLHQSVVPHIFICNEYGHLKRKQRLQVLQKLYKELNFDSLRQVDVDEECLPTIEQQSKIRKATVQQKTMRNVKRKKLDCKMEEIKTNKTVFIEMPTFEIEDKPDYVEIKDSDDVDTIVIDDSDSDER